MGKAALQQKLQELREERNRSEMSRNMLLDRQSILERISNTYDDKKANLEAEISKYEDLVENRVQMRSAERKKWTNSANPSTQEVQSIMKREKITLEKMAAEME